MNANLNNLSRIHGSIIILAIAVLDQVTKWIVTSTIALGQTITLLPTIMLTHTTNKGIAFGLLPQFALLYILISAGFVVAVYYFWHTWSTPTKIAMAIIAGGAVGNLIDRVARGHVIDWFGITWFSVFNLADAAITIGAILVLVSEYILNKKRNHK